MQGKINDERDTVEPPIKDKIGPKLGTDWATNKTASSIDKRMMILFGPNSLMYANKIRLIMKYI